MLIDIRPDEFESKSLGLQTVAPTVYRTGTTTESAADTYYNLVRVKSGFWLTKRKEMKRTVKENAGQSERKVRNNGRRVEAGG